MGIKKLYGIISKYQKSMIQSEAEVRSKLIVPLIEWLGYPSEYRSEEFPIYGFEGGKKLPAKNADFLLFNDSFFANHKAFSKIHIDWVQAHSLLVFEAKKPGEMPEILGQLQYYCVWSKAIAYLETDGMTIQGYAYDELTTDRIVISCPINELLDNKDFLLFCYDNLCKIKEYRNQATAKQILSLQNTVFPINNNCDEEINHIESDKITYPPEVIRMTKEALGKNGTGLTDCELVERFLRLTDSFLQNDIRYDIPDYMISIPRRSVSGKLYINGLVIPVLQGEITQYYQNEFEILVFKNEFATIEIRLENDVVQECSLYYCVHDYSVDARISKLRSLKDIVDSKSLKLVPNELDNRLKTVCVNYYNKSVFDNDGSVLYWLKELEKMKTIEDYYNIKFALKPIDTPEESSILYSSVDFVYDGISREANCHLPISEVASKLTEPITIDEPVLAQSGNIMLDSLTIHNYKFIPKAIYWLPCVITNKTIAIDSCATFEVETA